MPSSQKSQPRNGWIELFRFVFALLIVFYHGTAFLPADSNFLRCTNGAIAVEFFFILSGFLMAKSAKRKLRENAPIGLDSARFIIKKYTSIFPYHLFSYICAFIVAILIQKLTFSGAVKLLANSLPNLFMLDMVGLLSDMVAGYVWFISAMLIAMAIYYPILRYRFSLFVHVGAPLIALLLLGWISHTYGTLTWVSLWTGLTFKGVLRALAEVALGCAAFAVYDKIKEMQFTRFGKVSLLLVELFGYFVTVLYAFTKTSEKFYFYLVFFMAISIAITFSGKTITGRLGDHKWISFLGKLSLAIYLNQYYVYLIVEHYLRDLSGNYRLLLFALFTVIAAVICMGVVDFIRKKIPLKQYFIRKD